MPELEFAGVGASFVCDQIRVEVLLESAGSDPESQLQSARLAGSLPPPPRAVVLRSEGLAPGQSAALATVFAVLALQLVVFAQR